MSSNNFKIKFFIILLMLVALVMVGYFYSQQFKSSEVVFFNVGQGDSIFIRTADNYKILIDGGPDKTVLFKLAEQLPFYDRQLDLVILTHPHADHVTGLVEVLKRHTVKQVALVGSVDTAPAYLAFLKIIQTKNIPVLKVFKGQEVILGTASLKFLSPPANSAEVKGGDLNDASAVFKLSFKGQDFLLMGDAGLKVEEQLLKDFTAADLKSTVIKIGHHGSDYSSGADFLAAVQPQTAVISVGKNSYGHPSPRLLKRLERLKVTILRTDQDGDIVF
ncbi:MAG TPA: MBL fold metallo-hydrolase [bacterium]|nr:MBL fold metallo-hydrolase [bacterium]